MIIITCKIFPIVTGNNNNLVLLKKDYFSSIEYIDNEYDEVLIKKLYKDDITYCNLKNEYHNPIGPAYIQFYKNSSTIKIQRYCENGKYHRLKGPAFKRFYENGNLKLEEFCVNGFLHRIDGPAYIDYNLDGTILMKLYYIENDLIFEKDFKKKVKNLNKQNTEAQ